MPGFRLPVHELLGLDIMPRTTPLDGITGQGKRCPREPDQRDPASQGLTSLSDCVRYVVQFTSIHDPQTLDRSSVPNRLVDHWPLAFLEIEAEPHRFQRQEKIGKNDGRVERKT